MGFRDDDALNIADLRDIARRRLPKCVFEFVDRGTEDGVAVDANKAALAAIKLRPRVLVDVSACNQQVELFGVKYQRPLIVAPTGMAGLLWYEGEVALARAAKEQGIPFALSTASITPMERVIEQAGGRLWFQLYMWPERQMSYQLIARAQAAGYEALIVTADTPVAPNREYNVRNGFTVPFGLNRRNFMDFVFRPGWVAGVMARYLMTTGMPQSANLPDELSRMVTPDRTAYATTPKSSSVTWEDFKQIRNVWRGPLILKGVLRADDAVRARNCGADGVIVSNHGGRNLDSSIPPILALPQIVDAVGDRVTVMIDSGFARGSDVAKALALGAKAVMLGRTPLWGVAAAGEEGARRALHIMGSELDRVMSFMGCASLDALNGDCLYSAQARRDEPPSHIAPHGDGIHAVS